MALAAEFWFLCCWVHSQPSKHRLQAELFFLLVDETVSATLRLPLLLPTQRNSLTVWTSSFKWVTYYIGWFIVFSCPAVLLPYSKCWSHDSPQALPCSASYTKKAFCIRSNKQIQNWKKRTKQKPDIPSGLEIDDEAGYWQHCCAEIIESKKKKAYLQLIPGPWRLRDFVEHPLARENLTFSLRNWSPFLPWRLGLQLSIFLMWNTSILKTSW